MLAFWCKQLGEQEPGDDPSSHCVTRHGVTFPAFAKIEVNGEGAHPLYRYRTSPSDPDPIRRDFTNFSSDRQGDLVGPVERAALRPEVLPQE